LPVSPAHPWCDHPTMRIYRRRVWRDAIFDENMMKMTEQNAKNLYNNGIIHNSNKRDLRKSRSMI